MIAVFSDFAVMVEFCRKRVSEFRRPDGGVGLERRIARAWNPKRNQ
jgi:hypothetical protein